MAVSAVYRQPSVSPGDEGCNRRIVEVQTVLADRAATHGHYIQHPRYAGMAAVWMLENLVEGKPVNQISAREDVANNARVASRHRQEL